jgi:predicted Zn-dependent peptidase
LLVNFLYQYAERLPIGTEKVIRTVPHKTVKHFYQKWYHLSNMAVFAVGDFPDTQVSILHSFLYLIEL